MDAVLKEILDGAARPAGRSAGTGAGAGRGTCTAGSAGGSTGGSTGRAGPGPAVARRSSAAVHRHIDHVDVDKGVGRAPVAVSAGLAVLLRLLQVLLLHDLLALDHGVPAVRALVLALHAAGAAARAVLVVLDLRADDLFLRLRAAVAAAKSRAAREPADEPRDHHKGHGHDKNEKSQPDQAKDHIFRGEFIRIGAVPAAGVIVDSMESGGYWFYTYVFPMAIQPVAVPDTTGSVEPFDPEHGPFCGAAGTEGSTAIAANSTAIVAWATGVELTRGRQNITNPDGPRADFGGDTNAIGMATMDNTMDAVSLGDGGSALVTFARPIRNGEGFDFAVYENAFGDGSLELAFVEVSTDGQRFVRFPATCLTQSETQLGNAGQSDPTNLNNLAGKYRIGFGTPFDLEELTDSTGINIDSIVYVRIVDVVGSIDPQYGTYDAFGHIINDPWPTPFESSGFDLTGVAVMHERTDVEGIDNVAAAIKSVWPNPTSDYVNVGVSHAVEAVLYDLFRLQSCEKGRNFAAENVFLWTRLLVLIIRNMAR